MKERASVQTMSKLRQHMIDNPQESQLNTAYELNVAVNTVTRMNKTLRDEGFDRRVESRKRTPLTIGQLTDIAVRMWKIRNGSKKETIRDIAAEYKMPTPESLTNRLRLFVRKINAYGGLGEYYKAPTSAIRPRKKSKFTPTNSLQAQAWDSSLVIDDQIMKSSHMATKSTR